MPEMQLLLLAVVKVVKVDVMNNNDRQMKYLSSILDYWCVFFLLVLCEYEK